MTGESRLALRTRDAVVIGLALLLIGAGAAFVFMHNGADAANRGSARTTGTTSGTPPSGVGSVVRMVSRSEPTPDVTVSLGEEAVTRAGIVVATVANGTPGSRLRLPGLVEPNAYRRIVVTPLVAGRVTRVATELGARVRRGQTIAEVYSPALSEAQAKYVSATAMLAAHERELQRTQKLVEIGAASRQEMERVHAEHAAQDAAVQSARAQLELLGVSALALDALASGRPVSASTSVPAPIDGVVTERAVNVGLNVDTTTALFTVVDLSTVWVVADVYEKDFSRVQVGRTATVTTRAYPGQSLRGQISYIDPRVDPDTRTAKVRVEISNPRGELKLGMYADVAVAEGPAASVPVVPQSAVQNIGDRTVVYLADPKRPGQFTERVVHLGQASGDQVEVTSGIKAGDLVVTEGSFFVRAEREGKPTNP